MKTNLFKSLALASIAVPALLAHDINDHKLSPAVFVMTNAFEENQILMYGRLPDGTLQWIGTTNTGGRGSGGTVDPLGSQGSLTLSQDHSMLFAVNAGSGSVSSFFVGDRLELRDVKSTEGSAPVAVAQFGQLLYVLNFAGNSNVVGFKIDDGRLLPIPNSIRYLTSANSGAASLTFSPDGKFLAVTEKLNNNIDVYPVNGDGTLGAPVIYKDPTAGLFAAEFAPDGALLVVQAGSASISSFSVDSTGNLSPLSADVSTVGAAPCWLAITTDGQRVYTSNAGGANIAGFSLSGAGFLTPVNGTIAGSNPAGSTNLDIAIDGGNHFVYTLNAGTGTVSTFAIQQDGTLKLLGTVAGPAAQSGENGIAAL